MKNHQINVRGKLMEMSNPKVMAIVNMTPDSFYDGGRYTENEAFKSRIDQVIVDGADIIDVGGMSSRPGADIIDPEEEWIRVAPAIEYIIDQYEGATISIDTIHSEVAKKALDLGVHIINDISGGAYDESIIDTAVAYDAPYIMMHMQGTPADMQRFVDYEDIILDIMKYFNTRIRRYRDRGLKDIIIDPGIGFSKTVNDNFKLINHLSSFSITDCPILVGVSRKSFIYKSLDVSKEDALAGTIAMNMVSLTNGADILRVHDVREAVECVKLYRQLSVND